MIKYMILGACVSFGLAMLTLLVMILPMAEFSIYTLLDTLFLGGMCFLFANMKPLI